MALRFQPAPCIVRQFRKMFARQFSLTPGNRLHTSLQGALGSQTIEVAGRGEALVLTQDLTITEEASRRLRIALHARCSPTVPSPDHQTSSAPHGQYRTRVTPEEGLRSPRRSSRPGRGVALSLVFRSGRASGMKRSMGMRLSEIVETSARVAEASGRLVKIGHLAEALRQAGPGEARVAVGLLTGVPRQGRIGIGFAQLREARAEPAAAEPTLTLAEVDAAFERLLAIRGKGAAGERLRELKKAVRAGDAGGAGFSGAAAGRRTAPGGARGGDGRGGRQGGGVAGGGRAARGDAGGRSRGRGRGGAWRGGGRAGAVRHASCSGRCSRCWRSRPRMPGMRWRGSARRRSSGSSMARACRSIKAATRSGCSRASSTR